MLDGRPASEMHKVMSLFRMGTGPPRDASSPSWLGLSPGAGEGDGGGSSGCGRRGPPDSVAGMASIFITGSSDGIGLETARQLIRAGHQVTLHARSVERADALADQVDEAHGIAVGDLSVLSGIRQVAA